MPSYIISYDLCEPGQDYENLINKIKSYATWGKINKSTWVVNSAERSTDIRNKLKPYVDRGDKLFVAKLTGEAAWTNCDCSDNWLKANL